MELMCVFFFKLRQFKRAWECASICWRLFFVEFSDYFSEKCHDYIKSSTKIAPHLETRKHYLLGVFPFSSRPTSNFLPTQFKQMMRTPVGALLKCIYVNADLMNEQNHILFADYYSKIFRC